MFVPLTSKFQTPINFMRAFRYQKTVKNPKAKDIIISLIFAFRFQNVLKSVSYAVNMGQESRSLKVKKNFFVPFNCGHLSARWQRSSGKNRKQKIHFLSIYNIHSATKASSILKQLNRATWHWCCDDWEHT